VLLGSPADIGTDASWGMSTWQFVVNPSPNGASRLLTPGRYDHADDWKSRLVFGRFPIEVISFVMSRKMMLEIKRLAERSG
jgi:hypothetical protein